MKVSQDRLKHQEPYYPHNAAHSLESPLPSDEASHPQEDSNPQGGPLEAKRRVQPSLATPPEEFYHDSSPQQAEYDPEPQKANGPYQAVVVFLLLLMSLVILAIVYQLFFRANTDALPLQVEAAQANDVPENLPPALENLQAEEAQESPEALSSPLSSITPNGEVLPPPYPPPASQAAPQVPPPVSKEQPIISKIGGMAYWIQVGAFSSFKNANGIKQQLSQQHIESVIQESAGTRKFYRVRVGLYASKEEAKRILRQLHNIGHPFRSSIIIEVEI